MTPVDVLVELPPEQRATLLPHVAPWVSRAYRLKVRDAAILAALEACDAADPTVRACELERRLKTYVGGAAWKLERNLGALPDTATVMARRLHALAKANDGDGLGWRRIHGIACAAQR